MDKSGSNSLELLRRVFDRIQRAGFAPLVFGGWAEELLRLAPARPHRDIDLLLQAESFAPLDLFLASNESGYWRGIAAKRFAHKRAALAEGVMVEFTLVEPDLITRFWGDVAFQWLDPLAQAQPAEGAGSNPPIVSAANLLRYQQLHRKTEPWRWRDQAISDAVTRDGD
jgi:hypothetical protein